ncbi:MAG: 4Fe-4S binding protein [Atopobiaceae bacterium]|nr:4Fe-4S binding protein [Atopobiaceae bacterium]
MAVTVDTDLCVGCGACASECPCDALTVDEVAEVDADACVECGLCVDTCPCEALSL